MMDEKHVVEKVIVDVNVASMETAEKVKLEISDFIQNEVLSIVESYFKGLSLSPELKEKVIQLDRVDLSIDTSSWNIHSNELKQEIKAEVEKKIDPILKRAHEKDLLLKDQAVEDAKFLDQDLQVYEKEERVLNSLFHFLDRGTLPWWLVSLDESRELFSEKTLLKAIRNNLNYVSREIEKRNSSKVISERLIRQFSTTVLTDLLSIRLSGSASETNSTQGIQEIEKLPKEISKEILSLLWELSDEKVKSGLFQSDTGGQLFQHIHRQFLKSELSESVLKLSLIATHTTLRYLYLIAGKVSQKTGLKQVKTELEDSLINKIPSEVLIPLQSTKAYKELFIVNRKVGSQQSENTTHPNLDTEATNYGDNSDDHKLHSVPQTESETRVDRKNSASEKDLQDSDLKGDTNKSIESNQDQELNSSQKEVPESKESDSQENTSPTKTDNNVEASSEYINDESSLAKDKIDQDSSPNDSTNDSTNAPTNEGNDTSFEESSDQSIEKQPRKSTGNELENTDQNSDSLSDSSQRRKTNQESTDSLNSRNNSDTSKMKEGVKESKSPNDISSNEENKKSNKQTSDSGEILSEALKLSIKKSSKPKEKRTASMPDQLFVNNAGLVLLNPFLPALFKELGLLTDDGKLNNPELAACILHYAATGREGDFEFEMTFEKYLCGIPPSVSLEKEIILNDIHKEQVAKVLNSVLEHWNALKSKSPALLQNEFLTRQGKLIIENSNDRLVIERKTFDLLLDKLPWSYSMIKFSWKKELIYVEW